MEQQILAVSNLRCLPGHCWPVFNHPGPQTPGCGGSLAATCATPLMTRLVELAWLAQWVSSSSSVLHGHPYQSCTLVGEGDLPMEMVLLIGQGFTVALPPARTNLQTSSRFMAINAVTAVSLIILQWPARDLKKIFPEWSGHRGCAVFSLGTCSDNRWADVFPLARVGLRVC